MAIIKSTRDWKGVTVEERINTDTGQIEIYSPPTRGGMGSVNPGTKLAETFQDGDKNKWRITDKEGYRTLVNNSLKNQNQRPLTPDKFEQEFYEEGAPFFNNDRAATLNNNDNYSSDLEARTNREAFYANNLPLIIDPDSKKQVSSLGVKTTEAINGEQEDEESKTTFESSGKEDDDAKAVAAEYGKTRPGGGTKENLRYPLKITGPFTYDFIQITARDYIPSGLGSGGGDEYYKVDKNLGASYETISLPMQPTLSETNGVSWSDDQLNPIQRMFGEMARGAITGISNMSFDQVMEAAGNLGGNMEDAFGSRATKPFVTAYFAGQAVGANLVGRSTGMVINPNLELLFNGPSLRTFNFNFKLTPRSKKESEVCRKIIRAFKRNMAVSRTEANLFLMSPRLFQLKYIFKDDTSKDHPYLNKFKPCAMTNFGVNYTPDGSYATFDTTGSMTQYNLDMSFTEVMPIYAEDIPADKTETMGF